MADGPPDTYDYDPATKINTDEKFLRDSHGNPIMGEGVKANLEGLEGFAKNVDKISANFRSMSQSILNPMQDMIKEAFASKNQGLPWAGYMAKLAGHNLTKLSEFNGQIAIGVMNVASAAQVVANVYHDTDAGSAANLNAINFAFGDTKHPPEGVPDEILKQLKTWETFNKENPAFAAQMGAVAPAGPPDIKTSPDGKTVTTTVVIPGPDGKNITMVTTEEAWSTYPGGPSGVNTTVKYNGHVQSVTSTTNVGGVKTTTTTQTYYDQDGNKKYDRVTGKTTESWKVQGEGATTTLVKDTSSTTYEYNEKGEQTDETTVDSSVATGYDPEAVDMPEPFQDPASVKKNEISPMPQHG